jgi:hypothetical protein
MPHMSAAAALASPTVTQGCPGGLTMLLQLHESQLQHQKLLVEQFARSLSRWELTCRNSRGEYGLYAWGAECQSNSLRWQQKLAEAAV